MPDPFDLLRTALVPADPDRAFVTRLRERLARALDLPKGVTVSGHHPDPGVGPAAVDVTATSSAVTPYLAVASAWDALDWYEDAFGARVRGEPIVMADGSIGHAELDLGGATLMLSEEHPEIGVTAPEPGAGAAVTVHLQVADVDVVIERAVAAGARLERAAADYDYGRNGVVRDPFGHRWLISAAPHPPELRHGDIGYVSLWVPDVERAAEFFSDVLGWRYAPAGGHQGRQVEGLALRHGLWEGAGPPTLLCCFAVEDVGAAADRVEAAGGAAGAPLAEPYGTLSECTDDQGVRFALLQPLGGVAPGRPSAASGAGQGELAYVTMEVVDSSRARAFYGTVLGWRFAPGQVADGWQVEDVAPMVGLSGGHQRATIVPMYRVDDIAATVGAVRAAGGTATEPERQPYGITATCRDDQGARFYLGQL
ncbi:MAG: VOC family protein [Acidimicrobiales bacterium]